MASFLFVYGSLRSTEPFNDAQAYLLSYATYYGEATIQGTVYQVDNFPALVENGEDTIQGELYKVLESTSLFDYLDDYEDYQPDNLTDSLYVRKKKDVRTDKGNKLEAWVYIYNQPIDEEIKNS